MAFNDVLVFHGEETTLENVRDEITDLRIGLAAAQQQGLNNEEDVLNFEILKANYNDLFNEHVVDWPGPFTNNPYRLARLDRLLQAVDEAISWYELLLTQQQAGAVLEPEALAELEELKDAVNHWAHNVHPADGLLFVELGGDHQ